MFFIIFYRKLGALVARANLFLPFLLKIVLLSNSNWALIQVKHPPTAETIITSFHFKQAHSLVNKHCFAAREEETIQNVIIPYILHLHLDEI